MANRYLTAKHSERVELRPFISTDALPVVDLLYRAFGYTSRSFDGRSYDPDALAAEAELGRLSAVLAVSPSGRVVGFLALRPRGEGWWEVATLAADPALGESEIVHRLCAAGLESAGRLGLRKLSAGILIRHMEAQKATALSGFVPAAIRPAARLSGLAVRGLQQAQSAEREGELYAVAWIARRESAVYLPTRHACAIRAIYRSHGLARRELDLPGARSAPQPGPSEVDVELVERELSALVTVRRAGSDLAERLLAVADDLRDGFIEHVELRLPLDDPHAVAALEPLEKARFFFCGVDPDANGRDELVLAAIHGAVPRFDPSALYLDSAQELLRHVQRCAPESAERGARPGPRKGAEKGSNGPRLIAQAAKAVTECAERAGLLENARLHATKQLAAGLCHEINNPLNIILGSTQVLKQRARIAGEREALEHLGTIEEEVSRIARLLDNLRRVANPEETPRTFTQLVTVLEDALALLRGLFRARSVNVRASYAPDLPLVDGNASELEQAFLQLLLNACEASEEGGEVSVVARRADGGIEVAVRDLGTGIDPENLPHCFEPFFTTKGPGAAVGLGLKIARTIVASHRGRLALESRPGEGTTARIFLPSSEHERTRA